LEGDEGFGRLAVAEEGDVEELAGLEGAFEFIELGAVEEGLAVEGG